MTRFQIICEIVKHSFKQFFVSAVALIFSLLLIPFACFGNPFYLDSLREMVEITSKQLAVTAFLIPIMTLLTPFVYLDEKLGTHMTDFVKLEESEG